jgi:hypothetical protein
VTDVKTAAKDRAFAAQFTPVTIKGSNSNQGYLTPIELAQFRHLGQEQCAVRGPTPLIAVSLCDNARP